MLDFLTTIFGQNMGRLSFTLSTYYETAKVPPFHVLQLTFDDKQCISIHLKDLPSVDTKAMIDVANRIAAIQADLV